MGQQRAARADCFGGAASCPVWSTACSAGKSCCSPLVPSSIFTARVHARSIHRAENNDEGGPTSAGQARACPGCLPGACACTASCTPPISASTNATPGRLGESEERIVAVVAVDRRCRRVFYKTPPHIGSKFIQRYLSLPAPRHHHGRLTNAAARAPLHDAADRLFTARGTLSAPAAQSTAARRRRHRGEHLSAPVPTPAV